MGKDTNILLKCAAFNMCRDVFNGNFILYNVDAGIAGVNLSPRPGNVFAECVPLLRLRRQPIPAGWLLGCASHS